MELIGQNLIAAVREPKKDEYRLAMACASAMAGMAFSNSMVGVAHAIAHALGAVCQLPHGEAVGLLLPKVMRWQMDVQAPRYGELLCAFCGAEYYAEIPYQQRGKSWWRPSRTPCCTCTRSAASRRRCGTRGQPPQFEADCAGGAQRRRDAGKPEAGRPGGCRKHSGKRAVAGFYKEEGIKKSTVVEVIPQRCFF